LLQFNVTAAIKVAPRYVAGGVIAAVTAALQEAFSFSKRNFAQPVSAAEVMLTIQSVDGVVASDLSQLYGSDDPAGPSQIEPAAYLLAQPAHWDGSKIVPAQLLLINNAGIEITELKT
jgi:hypothetical protein